MSPDGNVVALSYSRSYVIGDTLQAKADYRIGLLDSKTGRETKVLVGHEDQIGRLAFSPSGDVLLSESGDKTARGWDVKTGKEVLLIKLKEKGAAVAFSPGGKVVAIATQPIWDTSNPPIVGLYHVNTGQLVREFPRSRNAVSGLTFSPDGRVLAIASGDAGGAQVDLWNLDSQASPVTLPMEGRELKDLRYSNDGRFLAFGGYGNGRGFVEARDLTADKISGGLKLDSAVNSLDFSRDGTRLVMGTANGRVIVRNVQARR